MQVTANIETITPELAKEYLALNTRNRPISAAVIRRYTRDMLNGDWALTGEPIIFADNGTLVDGQHRLHACVKSGVTIKNAVVRGVPVESFAVMNTGKMRSASDALALQGVPNYVHVATGARAIIRYTERALGLGKPAITNTDVTKCVEAHPLLVDWAAMLRSRSDGKRVPASAIGFLTLVSEVYGKDAFESFVHKLVTGENAPSGDPALALRNTILGMRGGASLTTEATDVFIIKALNAYIEGKPLKLMRYRPDHGFPLLTGVRVERI